MSETAVVDTLLPRLDAQCPLSYTEADSLSVFQNCTRRDPLFWKKSTVSAQMIKKPKVLLESTT